MRLTEPVPRAAEPDDILLTAPALVQAERVRRARLRVAEKITDLIGDTPIVRLRSFEKETPGVELWAKCEFFNPGGSVKDRAAYQMIRDAIRSGALTPGKTIIDSTSGNTGVAYSLIGGALGYPVTLVMPANVSWARQKITRAFGTELVFSDAMEGSDGAIRLCRKMVADNPAAYFYPDQYSNPSNPLAHYLGTGREIWEQTEGRVTHFVAGIGTSGTVMGTGRRLKDYRRDIQVWAVEPDDALHGLEGLKHMASSLVPAIYHPQELDGVIAMPTEEAWDVSERLAKEEGILVGHSSGGSLAGGMRLARELAAAGRPGVVVVLFPDRADRYFEAPIPVPKQAKEAKEAKEAKPATTEATTSDPATETPR
jgi:cysteine synthase B